MKNPRLIDMAGMHFGEWVVVQKVGNSPKGAALWLCRCSCGTEKTVVGGDLRIGKSVSCGCKGSRTTIGARSATHRMKGTRIHNCWSNMLRRCRDTSNKTYGGKGITVCVEWFKFESFYAWALISGYRDDFSIERKDNALGYNPDNCTWADRKTQSRNRHIVHKTADGVTFAEIAEQSGVSVAVMNNRVAAGGWTHEKAATTPIGAPRKKLARKSNGTFEKSKNPWRR